LAIVGRATNGVVIGRGEGDPRVTRSDSLQASIHHESRAVRELDNRPRENREFDPGWHLDLTLHDVGRCRST